MFQLNLIPRMGSLLRASTSNGMRSIPSLNRSTLSSILDPQIPFHSRFSSFSSKSSLNPSILSSASFLSSNPKLTLSPSFSDFPSLSLRSFSSSPFPALDQQQKPRLTSSSSPSKSLLSRSLAIGSGLVVLAGKTKYLFLALKLTKLSSVLSLLASSAAYAFIYGPLFGVGMVSMILVHESCHALAMRRYNIPFSPMVFLPFVGAFVSMKEDPPDAKTEAHIALAGPIGGGAFAALTSVLGIAAGSQVLLALAQFGLMINLFNLLPVGFLDGGRVAGVLSKWLLLGGWGIGAALVLSGAVHSPLFYLIMLAATWSTFSRFWGEYRGTVDARYYQIGGQARLRISAAYVLTIVALLAFSALNAKYLSSPAALKAQRRRESPGAEAPMSDFEKSVIEWSRDEENDDYYENDGRYHQQYNRQKRWYD